LAMAICEGLVVAVMYMIPETINPIVAKAVAKPVRLFPTFVTTVSRVVWARDMAGKNNTTINKIKNAVFLFTLI